MIAQPRVRKAWWMPARISHQTSLIRVQKLDDRQLAIVLCALIALSGRDAIAVGTRV